MKSGMIPGELFTFALFMSVVMIGVVFVLSVLCVICTAVLLIRALLLLRNERACDE